MPSRKINRCWVVQLQYPECEIVCLPWIQNKRCRACRPIERGDTHLVEVRAHCPEQDVALVELGETALCLLPGPTVGEKQRLRGNGVDRDIRASGRLRRRSAALHALA